jgi:hypothetical protein
LWTSAPDAVKPLARFYAAWHDGFTTSDCRATGETVVANADENEKSLPSRERRWNFDATLGRAIGAGARNTKLSQ